MAPDTKTRMDKLRQALDSTCYPRNGTRKPKAPPADILNILKKHCSELGLRFEQDKVADLILLLAAFKAGTEAKQR